jgi:hypothetical protein
MRPPANWRVPYVVVQAHVHNRLKTKNFLETLHAA